MKVKFNLLKKLTSKQKARSSVITIMFKAAGGPGISDIEKSMITESLMYLLANTKQAVKAGKIVFPIPDFNRYCMRVSTWFGDGKLKPNLVHQGVIKLNDVLTDPDLVITFIDVRCTDEPLRYDVIAGSRRIMNTTELPEYVETYNPTLPPSYRHRAQRRPLSYLQATEQTQEDLTLMYTDTSPIEPLACASAPQQSTVNSRDGLCVYVMEDMISTNISLEVRARIICHDVAYQVLSLTHYSLQGNLVDEIRVKNDVKNYPDAALKSPGSWSFFVDCFNMQKMIDFKSNPKIFPREIYDEDEMRH